MKKIALVFAAGLILGGCSLAPQRSGAEIMSNPPAKVYIDGKEAGMTPYRNNNLKPGEMQLKLVTSDGSEWQKQIRLENYSDTVVDWEMGDQQSGYILTLERLGGQKSGLLVNAAPNSAAVAIDGEMKGFSPLKIEDVQEGDKQITISYPGYQSQTIFAKGVAGYQLVAEVILAPETPTVTTTPTPTPTEELNQNYVTIKTTETGWLRVRDAAAASGKEIARVNPGEKYVLLEENNGWSKIKVNATISGWVSSAYVTKAGQ
ncbi:SH3 domain-containing protein [Patescibacteria group bacterium]|nr:SH3 domain-containing protein [Patescibacteria group bacterium]